MSIDFIFDLNIGWTTKNLPTNQIHPSFACEELINFIQYITDV